MKRFLLSGFAVTVVGVTLAAGCGSGGRTISVPASTPTPTPVPTPTPIGASPTPTPTPTPVATTRAGDFAFVGSDQHTFTSTNVLSSTGAGSASFSLQSINGFTSPITFASTVTATSDVDGSTVNPGVVGVTFSPATLATLPAGTTPVTLSVQAPTALPPLTRVKVAISALGGGLKRYPNVGTYSNGGGFYFITPGLLFTSVNVPFDIPGTSTRNMFSGDTGSSLAATAAIETYGLSGTATLGVTGLPAGLTAAFDKPTLAITPMPPTDLIGNTMNPEVVITFTANETIPEGIYPVHITATLNGTTYTSGELDIAVGSVAFN